MPLWGFFGPVHIGTLIAGVLMIVILYVCLKRASEKTQHIVLGVLSFAGWATIIVVAEELNEVRGALE